MGTNQKRTILNGIWLANLLVIVGFWFAAYQDSLTGNTSNLLLALGGLSGFVAGYMLLTQMVLISGAPWLEQKWGLDHLSGSHAANGKVAFYFVFAHFALVVSAYVLRANGSLIADFVPTYLEVSLSEEIVLAAIGWYLIFTIVATSIVMVRSRLPYELWWLIHLAAYFAVLLPVFHQVNVGRTTNAFLAFKVYWIGLYVFTFATILYFKWVKPLWTYLKHRFVVDEVVQETEDIVSIYVTGKNLHEFKYDPGQFAKWWFFGKGLWWHPHPFTISSCPADDRLRLTVKNIGNGSKALLSVQPGTPVVVDGPYGRFTEAVRTKTKRLFIAGGVGVTPIAAQLRASSSKDDTVIYGARSINDLALRKEIGQSNARLIAVFSEQQHKGALHGRVDADVLSQNVNDITEHDVWLCGPPPMMDGVEKALHSLGVPASQIHTERFRL